MTRSNAVRAWVFLALALFVAAVSSRPALGCGCEGPDLRKNFWKADAVFVGRIVETAERVVEWDVGYGDGTAKYAQLLATFEVEESFRGAVGDRVEITGGFELLLEKGRGGNSCNLEFRNGQRYLICARRNNARGYLAADKCLGSRLFAADDADMAREIAYARRASRGETTPGVYGTLLGDSPPETTTDELSGVRIFVEGEGRSYECVTGDGGAFYREGIEPGTYTCRAVLSGGWRVREGYAETRVTVPERGCVEIRIAVTRFGSIRGRVVDAWGKLAPGVPLQLVSVGEGSRTRNSGWPFDATTSAEDGTYVFEAVPPGRYNVGVNPNGPPVYVDKEPQHRATYYSNGEANGLATVVALGECERVTLGDLRLAPPIPVVELHVDVLDANSRPFPGASVVCRFVRMAPNTLGASYEADARGEAVVRLCDGFRYTLRAEATGPNGRSIYSEEVVVAAGRGAKRVTLKLTGTARSR